MVIESWKKSVGISELCYFVHILIDDKTTIDSFNLDLDNQFKLHIYHENLKNMY